MKSIKWVLAPPALTMVALALAQNPSPPSQSQLPPPSPQSVLPSLPPAPKPLPTCPVVAQEQRAGGALRQRQMSAWDRTPLDQRQPGDGGHHKIPAPDARADAVARTPFARNPASLSARPRTPEILTFKKDGTFVLPPPLVRGGFDGTGALGAPATFDAEGNLFGSAKR
jgi:hypothetical protein